MAFNTQVDYETKEEAPCYPTVVPPELSGATVSGLPAGRHYQEGRSSSVSRKVSVCCASA